METDVVIRAESLGKIYKLYAQKSERLKEAVSLTRKKYHKAFHALNNISFEVSRGEVVGIIGTNGSGKSTLLKILTGVTSQSCGTMQVEGRISALLELGIGFNVEYTGIENIRLQGTMMGYKSDDFKKREQAIIDFAAIGEYINQPVKNYSSGMFARLAFAVAINVDPDILIVDEALSVGDVFFQSKCFRKFEELRQRGVTILFVSHDIQTIRRMCSRVLWIEQGEQKMYGDCIDVCNAYFNEQLKRMNNINTDTLYGDNINEVELKSALLNKSYPKIVPALNSILSDDVEILSVYVRDEAGHYVNTMNAGQRYTIGIVSKYNKDMDKIIVGFEFVNNKGLALLASNTYQESAQGLRIREGMTIDSRFFFQMPAIRPGEYAISPAVAIGTQNSHINLAWLHGVCQVTVTRAGDILSEVGADYEISSLEINELDLFDTN